MLYSYGHDRKSYNSFGVQAPHIAQQNTSFDLNSQNPNQVSFDVNFGMPPEYEDSDHEDLSIVVPEYSD